MVEDGATSPEQVYFELDASPIKDSYTLSYDWNGDEAVTWTLVEGKMLKAMDGALRSRRPATAAPRSPTAWPWTSPSR